MPQAAAGRQEFRLWITRVENWRPAAWTQIPPRAVAMTPAEEGAFSAEEATAYMQGFNSAILDAPQGVWAVAVPVVIRYDGDLRPGQVVAARMLHQPEEAACA